MSLTIPENDHGKIYLLDMDAGLAAKASGPTALAARMGVPSLNGDFIDIITISDLDRPEGETAEGLAWYLREGYAIELAPEHHPDLQSIGTHCLLLMSRALNGAGVMLPSNSGLRHVMTIADPNPNPDMSRMTSFSAQAETSTVVNVEPDGPQAPSRVYLYALLLIFAFFALMAWRIASGSV